MKRTLRRGTWVLLAALGCVGGVGCARKAAAPAPEPLAAPDAGEQASQHIAALELQMSDLTDVTGRLPGSGDEQHRQLMARVFGQYVQILGMLESRPSGGYSQQVMILQNAQRQLSARDSQLAEEPLIDTALRAAVRALSSLQDRYGVADGGRKVLDRLQPRLAELDNVRGPMHRLVASDVAGMALELARQVADGFVQQTQAEARLARPQSGPTTTPAAEPRPATAPSAEPATGRTAIPAAPQGPVQIQPPSPTPPPPPPTQRSQTPTAPAMPMNKE